MRKNVAEMQLDPQIVSQPWFDNWNAKRRLQRS